MHSPMAMAGQIAGREMETGDGWRGMAMARAGGDGRLVVTDSWDGNGKS